MADLRIGNAKLPVEGIRLLKADAKHDDAATRASLQKDGFDEIIFKKGDQVFIAFQKNMNLSNINLNLDAKTFDVNSAYDAGQLSLNGDAVQVLYVDDENKDSLWTQPLRSLGNGVKALVNDPYGKAALLGFAGGALTTVMGKNLNIETNYNGVAENVGQHRAWVSTFIGTGVGAAIGGLKAGAESDIPGEPDSLKGLAAAGAGYGVGALAGLGGNELFHLAKNNMKTAGIAAGVAAAVIGTGIALDLVSDNGKPSTYRVINSISAGTPVHQN